MNSKYLSSSVMRRLSIGSLVSFAFFLTGEKASAFSSYYVRHSFFVNFGNFNPNLTYGQVNGYAWASSPQGLDHDWYSQRRLAVGNPLVFAVSDSAFAQSDGSFAFAFSSANASLFGNILSGTTLARGWASAGTPGAAQASSRASLVAGQIGINPFGQITWIPLFGDTVSGTATDVQPPQRVRDPISYTVTDAATGDFVASGSLIDIFADFNNGNVEWGIASQDGENFTEDDQLDIRFDNAGIFEINLTDSALTNPGLFRVEADEQGLISNVVTTGRFTGLDSFIPTIGSQADFTLDFSALFPEELTLDYSFNNLNGGNPVNVDFNIYGNGLAEDVPEPLTLLGASAAAGFGAFFKRRSRKKA